MGAELTLLERARRGDRAAFGELAAGVEPRLRRYLLTMVGEEALAADLVQETFERALSHLEQLESNARFTSWLFAIGVNLCRSYLRRQVQRRPASLEQLEQPPASARAGVLTSLVRRESAAALALAIDRLPVLLREAFVLRHVERLSYEEIAPIAGASPQTLHVRAHRARALLRQQLGALVDTFWSRGS